jgi:hypothetical protein
MRLFLLLPALCLVWCAAARAAGRPLPGLSANPKENATGPEFVQAIMDAKTAGVRMMYMSYKWSDLEPKEGAQNLKQLEDGLRWLTTLGFKIAVTIQTLDTNNRTLPADLMDKPFDAPEMRDRFDALLKNIAPKLTTAVRWVMLGNEADIYLTEHPKEVEAFAGFVEHGRQTLRALKPDIFVGITTTHDGVRDRPQIAQRLNRNMDVVTFTYYPLGPNFAVRSVAEVPADFERMARAAGNKPLFLQEIGYPADPLLGSSEEKQAAFVDAVFDAVSKHANKIVAFNYFLYHDFGDRLTDTFLKYYRLPDPRFRAFLATLGLKKADSTPRKAWERFQARAKAWKDD